MSFKKAMVGGLLVGGVAFLSSGFASEWSGYVAGEYRYFTQSALDQQQFNDASVSFSAAPEFYHSWNDGDDAFIFSSFFRWDEQDPQRTHIDLRELMWIHAERDWEVRLGVGKVFWGVTESQHLVDIINQSDMVENFDGEDKLGQTMLNLSLIKDWGTVDLFVLPGFKERTFSGKDGRFRPTPAIDDHTAYQSDSKDKHVDYAVRWSQTFDDWDVGVSHFYGTSREPRIIPTATAGGIALVPFYDLINQTGLDVQATLDEWLWKVELIHRSGQGETFNAFTGGFEYTFVGVMESAADVGLIAEYLYDDRGADVAFDNDIFVGARLAMNDAASSELLFGVIADVDQNTQFYSLEGSRRIGVSWVLSVEARFISAASNDALAPFRQDDVIQLEFARHF
ncbi:MULTISPECIES: hypothetical protein [Cycloclasticus]|uniref:Phosphate-selective porin O and P n=1 Tax=Cycloclasticus pugetii TaxID=34068 RepID=A0AB33YZS9_9GAMM|nr:MULTISPECIES: hypothetical protein [Cycloclasticus]ATI02392.1 hypothetical protein CPC19_02600 [Cycloclasticus sp. PY97N]EPD12481.1 hypothetical protein L196_10184 [Cycloclasticus pugetii]